MEETTNKNNKPLENPIEELTPQEQRALKISLALYAVKRRVKSIFKGIKNRFYLA